MIKIILCFPRTVSTSQPGFTHADPASEEAGDAVSLATGTHDGKRFTALHVEARGCSYCSLGCTFAPASVPTQ